MRMRSLYYGLGIRLLVNNRLRLIIASASVAVAVIIMFVELGLLFGVLDSQALMAGLVRGDLIVMSSARTNLHKWDKIKRIRLDQIAALAPVEKVVPVYEDHANIKNPDDRRVRRIIVYAVPPDDIPIDLGDSAAIARRLKLPHGILFDQQSRPIFGTVRPGDEIEVDQYPLPVNGYVRLGPDIANDGAIVMSEGDWLDRAPWAEPIMGVIRLKTGVAVETARETILAALPEDIVVLTPGELRQRENEFTLRSAPFGILCAVGMLAGLVIGTINCYQVLYNEVSDRLPQYATLKAMGFSNGFLRQIILEQAFGLSASGFAVGLVGSVIVERYIAWQTLLPIRITPISGGFTLLLTMAMCVLAGLIAIRRVAVADPASLY